jgi:hypothetical protein
VRISILESNYPFSSTEHPDNPFKNNEPIKVGEKRDALEFNIEVCDAEMEWNHDGLCSGMDLYYKVG